MKICTLCKEPKSIDEFYRGTGYRASRCKSCIALSSKDNQTARASRLKRLYGISLQQYDDMLAAQKGVCAICSKPPKKRRLCVDHCHKTGKVRGLLCDRCNHKLLPYAHDNPNVLQKAADYLRKAQSTSQA